MPQEIDAQFFKEDKTCLAAFASFQITAKQLSVESVTNTIGISPDRSWNATRGNRKFTGHWSISTVKQSGTNSVQVHACALFARLSPVQDGVLRLMNDRALVGDEEASVSIHFHFETLREEGFYVLSSEMLRKLSLFCDRFHFHFLCNVATLREVKAPK